MKLWAHRKTEQKIQSFFHIPSPPHMHSLPHHQHRQPEWDICWCTTLMNINWQILITQGSSFTFWFNLGIVHSMDLEKCVMICIHHYSSIRRIFIALKIFSALPVYLPYSTITSGNHWSFYCLMVLPFLEMS